MDINNDITVIGSVSEYSISIKECVRKLKDGPFYNAWWIGGKLDIEIDTDHFKINYNYLNTISYYRTGTENKSFSNILSVFGMEQLENEIKPTNLLVPKIKGTIVVKYLNGKTECFDVKGNDHPNRVSVKGQLGINKIISKDGKDLNKYLSLNGRWMFSDISSPNRTKFSVTGYITKIIKEEDSDKKESLSVVLAIPSFSSIDLYTFSIYNDIDEFNKNCKEGNTILAEGTIVKKKIERKENVASDFGVKETSGYTITELVIEYGNVITDAEQIIDSNELHKRLEALEIAEGKEFERQLNYKKSHEPVKTVSSALTALANSSNDELPFD